MLSVNNEDFQRESALFPVGGVHFLTVQSEIGSFFMVEVNTVRVAVCSEDFDLRHFPFLTPIYLNWHFLASSILNLKLKIKSKNDRKSRAWEMQT